MAGGSLPTACLGGSQAREEGVGGRQTVKFKVVGKEKEKVRFNNNDDVLYFSSSPYGLLVCRRPAFVTLAKPCV